LEPPMDCQGSMRANAVRARTQYGLSRLNVDSLWPPIWSPTPLYCGLSVRPRRGLGDETVPIQGTRPNFTGNFARLAQGQLLVKPSDVRPTTAAISDVRVEQLDVWQANAPFEWAKLEATFNADPHLHPVVVE